jgi:hypothetical protein
MFELFYLICKQLVYDVSFPVENWLLQSLGMKPGQILFQVVSSSLNQD